MADTCIRSAVLITRTEYKLSFKFKSLYNSNRKSVINKTAYLRASSWLQNSVQKPFKPMKAQTEGEALFDSLAQILETPQTLQ